MDFTTIQQDREVQIKGVNPEPAPGSGVRTPEVWKIQTKKLSNRKIYS
jgi:hypothetical protein